MRFGFHSPVFLWLLLLVPGYLWFYWRQQRGVALQFSSLHHLKKIGLSPAGLFRHLPALFRGLAILLVVVALSRPREGIQETRVSTEGVDIVLTLDVSGSMRAEDFGWKGKRVNRLQVAKNVIRDFVEGRKSDRIGLVVFAANAYSQCPLTVDYQVLDELLEKVHIGMVEDGTAIGSAIATSLNRLRQSKAKSKVIILLTDGVNNAGKIDPPTAARMAKTLGVKIYTIGVGSKKPVPYPVARDRAGQYIYRRVSIPLDDKSLEEIARITGGKYFSATDTGSLKRIFRIIDKMEKTKSKAIIYHRYRELFPYLVGAALALFFLAIGLEKTLLRRLP